MQTQAKLGAGDSPGMSRPYRQKAVRAENKSKSYGSTRNVQVIGDSRGDDRYVRVTDGSRVFEARKTLDCKGQTLKSGMTARMHRVEGEYEASSYGSSNLSRRSITQKN